MYTAISQADRTSNPVPYCRHIASGKARVLQMTDTEIYNALQTVKEGERMALYGQIYNEHLPFMKNAIGISVSGSNKSFPYDRKSHMDELLCKTGLKFVLGVDKYEKKGTFEAFLGTMIRNLNRDLVEKFRSKPHSVIAITDLYKQEGHNNNNQHVDMDMFPMPQLYQMPQPTAEDIIKHPLVKEATAKMKDRPRKAAEIYYLKTTAGTGYPGKGEQMEIKRNLAKEFGVSLSCVSKWIACWKGIVSQLIIEGRLQDDR